MTIYTHFLDPPIQRSVLNVLAIADQLAFKLTPVADAIEESGARLMLYYREKGPCRLVVNGPEGLQEEVANLVGPAETWS